jgi:hypothetical protein
MATKSNKERDIYQELRSVIGLTHDQCSEVMKLIDTLPIKIKDGISNTKVSILNGIITVEPSCVSEPVKCDCKHSGNCKYEELVLETKEFCGDKE